MADQKTIEQLYLEAAKKLRSSLPKFAIFLGTAYIIWLVGTIFFIPQTAGMLFKQISAAKLESLIIITAVIILLIASVFELNYVVDSLAELVICYVHHSENGYEEVRLRQTKRSFRNVGYLVPAIVGFVIFSSLINQIYPLANQIIPVVIAVWAVISLVMLAMVAGLNIEDSTKKFMERMTKSKPKAEKKEEKAKAA